MEEIFSRIRKELSSLNIISYGNRRHVYDIGHIMNGCVVKVVEEDYEDFCVYDNHENIMEYEIWNSANEMQKELICPVFGISDDSNMIIMKKLNPLEKMLDEEKIQDDEYNLYDYCDEEGISLNYNILYSIINKFNLHEEDILFLSNWGYDENSNLILLDYGLEN